MNNAAYSRRMRWVKKISDVFNLSIADVIEPLEGAITSARLEEDRNAIKRIKDQLVSFLQAGKV